MGCELEEQEDEDVFAKHLIVQALNFVIINLHIQRKVMIAILIMSNVKILMEMGKLLIG